jgi:hypothetical protein
MTITLTREEAQQVLDALEKISMGGHPDWANDVIPILRAQLSQPEPEPIAWAWGVNSGAGYYTRGIGFDKTDIPFAKHIPLYATPPQRDFKFSTTEEAKQPAPTPKKEPQLTDDEVQFAHAFTALLKSGYGKEAEIVLKSKKREWQGLTDAEAEQIVDDYWHDVDMFIEVIEAKLKEKNT